MSIIATVLLVCWHISLLLIAFNCDKWSPQTILVALWIMTGLGTGSALLRTYLLLYNLESGTMYVANLIWVAVATLFFSIWHYRLTYKLAVENSRFGKHQCIECGYQLEGRKACTCPECGSIFGS